MMVILHLHTVQGATDSVKTGLSGGLFKYMYIYLYYYLFIYALMLKQYLGTKSEGYKQPNVNWL